MTPHSFRALIVDDDSIARKTVRFALERENFSCTEATDGDQALKLLSQSKCDLVVTDLCMPKMHGHSLANELLTHESRPLIVIHSSFDDPRLIRELMIRGVDDFVFKPTNYTAFAAKVRVLAERRQAQQAESNLTTDSQVIPMYQIEAGKSQQVLNVYLSSVLPETQIEHLIDYIQNDPQLAADVVRTANSSQLNSSGRNIANVREAVCRLGFRRVADLALNMLKPIEA